VFSDDARAIARMNYLRRNRFTSAETIASDRGGSARDFVSDPRGTTIAEPRAFPRARPHIPRTLPARRYSPRAATRGVRSHDASVAWRHAGNRSSGV